MTLIIVHYHWRPGGVRSVVEGALPAVRAAVGAEAVVLAAGEPAPEDFRARIPGARWVTEPAFGYVSEGAAAELDAVRAAATRLLEPYGSRAVVLLENPAVGRHLALAPAFAEACGRAGARLLCHHHDFFFDARWDRWSEIARAGFQTFDSAWAAAFPRGPHVAHAVVSRLDSAALALPRWPNPAPVPTVQEPAFFWVKEQLSSSAPLWLVPCRLLRRKNVAEAVLLARLLAPGAVVATTGGASSADEADYAARLADELPELRIGLAARPGAPGVADLVAAASCVVVPSLFEGFGLPAREAVALGRPVLVRRAALAGDELPAAAVYADVPVPWHLFDAPREMERQGRLWHAFRAKMPRDVSVPDPAWWQDAGGVLAFSRLTLTAQLETLAHSAAVLRAEILPHWPQGEALLALAKAADLAQNGLRFATPGIPGEFAAAFQATWRLPLPAPAPVRPDASRLAFTHHFPLLWHSRT